MTKLGLRQATFLILVALFLLGAMQVSAQQCNCGEQMQNCAVPITVLDGQTFHVSGIASGLTLMDPSNPNRKNSVTGALLPPEEVRLPGWFTGASNITQDTVILVVDAFGDASHGAKGSYRIPEDVIHAGDDGTLQKDYDSGVLQHGMLVFNHINALIQSEIGGNAQPDSTDDTSVLWNISGKHLLVQMVNAFDYSQVFDPTPTDFVADQITQAIKTLSTPSGGSYKNFILNMSFAILPCNVIKGYETSSQNNPGMLFDQYVAGLQGAQTFYYSQLITPAESLVFPDHLHYLIGQCSAIKPESTISASAESVDKFEFDLPDGLAPLSDLYNELPCKGNSLTFIASAGNSTLPYVFYPAAYKEVQSVSAEQDNDLALYSNYNASTGLAGGWFQLSAFTNVDNTFGVIMPSIYYRGTSFSGPVEAACIALQMDPNSPPCASIKNH